MIWFYFISIADLIDSCVLTFETLKIKLVIIGKSTVACVLSQMLYQRGKLTYILDGDNVRHGLNRDLSFKAEDRAENIRRVGKFLVRWIATHIVLLVDSRTFGWWNTHFLIFSCFQFFLCIGEVAKLFADAGVICIACLISPYRADRDACRLMLPDGDFIEVGVSPAYELSLLSNCKCLKSWVFILVVFF